MNPGVASEGTHRELTRTQLLRAALSAIEELGYFTRSADIIKRAKLSPSTFYKHLPERDALMEALAAVTNLSDAASALPPVVSAPQGTRTVIAQAACANASAFDRILAVLRLHHWKVSEVPVSRDDTGCVYSTDYSQELSFRWSKGRPPGWMLSLEHVYVAAPGHQGLNRRAHVVLCVDGSGRVVRTALRCGERDPLIDPPRRDLIQFIIQASPRTRSHPLPDVGVPGSS